MAWFLYLVSILWVVMGAVFVLYTDWTRKFLKGMFETKNVRVLGLIPLVFGILMVISAGWSEIFLLIFLLGLIAMAKGFYLLFGPRKQTDLIISWWLDKASDQLYRFCGLIVLVLGIALLSWIQ